MNCKCRQGAKFLKSNMMLIMASLIYISKQIGEEIRSLHQGPTDENHLHLFSLNDHFVMNILIVKILKIRTPKNLL